MERVLCPLIPYSRQGKGSDMRNVLLGPTLFLLVLNGCNEQPIRETLEPKSSPGYSLVAIEIGLHNWLKDSGLLRDYDYGLAAERFRLAGQAVVPEFSLALEDADEGNREIAGWGLLALTSQGQESGRAYEYVIKRLKRLPPVSEATWLLYAVAHERIEKYPEIIPYAAHYIGDTTVVHRWILGKREVAVQVCDFACFVLQLAAKQEFGAVRERPNDDAIQKAKTWIGDNPERVRIMDSVPARKE